MLSTIEILGWIAASLTLAAFSMKTMVPLRITAICASVFFILYGYFAGTYPVMALHLALLPFNILRLVQLRRSNEAARLARTGDFSLDWIRSVMRPVKFSAGELIFRKGDPPHYIYYLQSGNVILDEIGETLEPGEIFGEIAFFTDAKERTLSAHCAGPCRIVLIDERTFTTLYYQNPAFGMFIVRLISRRLLDGIERNPAAYAPVEDKAD